MLDNLYIVECFRVYAASSSYYICLVKCAVKTVELNLYFFLKIVYKINHILNLYFFLKAIELYYMTAAKNSNFTCRKNKLVCIIEICKIHK